MTRSRAGALAIAAIATCGCRCSDPSSPLVQDFEGRAGLSKWPRDAKGEVAISQDWKSDGASSLRIDPGLLAAIESLLRTDFRGFDALRVHLHNPGDHLVPVGFELSDDHDTLYDRHRSAFGAAPGDSTVDIDLSGDLYRGEENRPFRGPTKTPLDLAKITRIAFENRGASPLYVDGLTLVKDPLDVPPGAFAFDFGKRGTRVMAKTRGVFEDTVYPGTAGFGFTGPTPTFLRDSATYPSPLLGDGLAWGDSAFDVDLPGGPTIGWIAFERAGFWETEDEATGYTLAALSANGAEVHRHTFSPAGPHFFFEDLEITTMADAWPKLIVPAHAISRFTFSAKPGKNTFTLRTQDLRGPPLRVAGLFLAPDTPEGKRYIDALEERQRAAFEKAFPPADHARRSPAGPATLAPSDAAAPPPRLGPIPAPIRTDALVVERRPTGEIGHPRDLPAEPAKGPEPLIALAVAGHKAYCQLQLHASRPLDLRPIATALAGTSALGSPAVWVGVYGPKRPYEGGAAWIETSHYRPLEGDGVVHVAPDLARTVVFEFDLPEDAPDGEALYNLSFLEGQTPLGALPLTLHVFRVALPPLPIPVGVFMSGLPFRPDALDEDRWWHLQEALLQAQGEAGLNTPTGGPGLGYTMSKSGDGYAFSGDAALRYLALAAKYGVNKAVVSYSGFLPSIKYNRPDAAQFQSSWSAFEESHGLPPHYLYAYDEPSTDEELSSVAAYLAPYHAAKTRTIGFFARPEGDRYRPVLDATFAPAVSGHTAADLRRFVAEGKHLFLYNRGVSRLSMGADLVSMIHLGASGRLEWIGLYSQGFAFDDLDAREPSFGMFAVHDRLGLFPTPRWLSLREGLLDARLRLALEKQGPRAALPTPSWPSDYPADAARYPDSALDSARAEALRALRGRE